MRRLLILAAVIALFFSCKMKQEKVQPVEEKITESVYASGIVKSKNQYQVFSSVNGLIKDVLVKEGDIVKRGQPLLRIDSRTASLNAENAQIAAEYGSVASNADKLHELKINIDLAKSKMDNDAALLERQRNLWQQQIGTRNDLDQKELAYKNSVTAYEAAKLRYTELQKQLSLQEKQTQKSLQISRSMTGDYTIKSEVDGKVYSVLKEKGEMVNVQTPVALLGDAADFTLELQVDEYDIARVRPGQKILLNMDSYKGQVFEAMVDKVDPLMNDRSKSFTVEAHFVKQPPQLFPNLTCEANIVIQQKEKALTIPRNCLLPGDSVLLQSKQKRKVTTGLMDYQKVEITGGLTASDIILKPAQ